MSISKNLQPRAEIAWKEINRRIMRAPCNTLVILDCENAELAAVAPAPPTSFRKELIGAWCWGNKNRHHMSRSLARALWAAQQLDGNDRMVTTSTLVRMMNDNLADDPHNTNAQGKVEERLNIPQAVHHVLTKAEVRTLYLERAVPRLG